jgi:hypothetical protein
MVTTTRPNTTRPSTEASAGPDVVVVPDAAPTSHRQVRRLIVEGVLVMVLLTGGGLLMWGSTFGKNMVHDQLSAQNIVFPAAGSAGLSAKEFPGLQQYGGQKVDNGPKAKAYADQFIGAHVKSIAGGKTYSEASAAARANPTDPKLQAQVDSLFKGETLRGLLLYAWGWSIVAAIAGYVAIAAFVGALIVLAAMAFAIAKPAHA